jgi:hypothetical protein
LRIKNEKFKFLKKHQKQKLKKRNNYKHFENPLKINHKEEKFEPKINIHYITV